MRDAHLSPIIPLHIASTPTLTSISPKLWSALVSQIALATRVTAETPLFGPCPSFQSSRRVDRQSILEHLHFALQPTQPRLEPAGLPLPTANNNFACNCSSSLPLSLPLNCCCASISSQNISACLCLTSIREKMLFPEEDSPLLKAWIVKRLENTFVAPSSPSSHRGQDFPADPRDQYLQIRCRCRRPCRLCLGPSAPR